MEYSSLALLFYTAICSVRYVDTRVVVRTPSLVEITLNKEPLVLECSYRTTGSEFVMSVNWNRKTAHGVNFKQIAQIPNRRWLNLPPTFSDKHLSSRGNVTTRTKGELEVVRLELRPTECHDEGTYECEVLVYGNQSPTKAKVQVRLNEKPSVTALKYNPASLIENHPVTFTCTASMGRPVGAFKWLVYKRERESGTEGVEMSGSTKLNFVPGSCSYIGASTLAIMVTRTDQRVKCVVQQQAKEDFVQVSEETALDVRYRVSDTEVYTRIGKTDLPVSRETAVPEGGNIHFLCRAHGNPKPTYKWSYLPLRGHKGSTALIQLMPQPEMSLKNLSANQSGAYVCVATNHLDNMDYTETKSVRIIVKEKATFGVQGLSSRSDTGERYLLICGVVTGAMLVTLTVSLLSFLYYRRCSHKSDVLQTRYTGVKA